MLNKNFSIYTAESKVKEWRQVIKAMLAGVISGRYLAYRLAVRDIRGSYAESRFGLLWDFMEPLVLAAVFTVLRRGNVISFGDIGIPYAVFVVFGLLLWQTFTESVTLPLGIMQNQRNLLTQLKVPPEALIMTIIFQILFRSIFRIAVMLLLAGLLGALSLVGVIKFLLLYPMLLLTGLAVGVFMAPFNIVYGDVGRAIQIFLRPLLYASPIIFYAPGIKALAYFYEVNPIAIMIMNLRSLATQNVFHNPWSFALTCVLMLLIFLSGWFIFHLSVPILSDKI